MAASLIRRIGTPRALAKLKTNPPFAQMFRIFYDASFAYGRGETDRRHIESPPACALFKFCDQLFRPHARPGCKYALIAKRHAQFYACAADIDDQDFSLHERPPLSAAMAIGRAGPVAARRSSVPVLVRCWQASIPQFQARGIGTASDEQISNRVADSSQFAGRTGHH